jgi:hypothetical protein
MPMEGYTWYRSHRIRMKVHEAQACIQFTHIDTVHFHFTDTDAM